jgi:predicted AAA+ superfamily ATPase
VANREESGMTDEEKRIEALIEKANSELALKRGKEAEQLLRQAYATIYDLLTPMHFKVIEIMRKLSDALDMQDKKAEANETKQLIREMLANNKNLLAKKKQDPEPRPN